MSIEYEVQRIFDNDLLPIIEDMIVVNGSSLSVQYEDQFIIETKDESEALALSSNLKQLIGDVLLDVLTCSMYVVGVKEFSNIDTMSEKFVEGSPRRLKEFLN